MKKTHKSSLDKEMYIFHIERFMKFGYAGVSATDQNLDLQIDDLKKAGCFEIVEKKSWPAKKDPLLICSDSD